MKTINWKFKEKECIICSKKFKPTNGKQITCSDECSYKRKFGYNTTYNKKHNKEYYLKHASKSKARANSYYEVSKLRLTEFGRELICADCDNKKELEIHHTSYTPNRYILICKNCHLKRHNKRSRK